MSESYYKPCRELEICDELIEKYFNTAQYEKCFEGHLALAEQGYPLAECQVGYFYYEGLGVEKDLEKAVWWTRRAADHGDRDGQCNLAWFYEDAIGVERDMEQAEFWYRQAALQGHDLATEKCRELGISLDDEITDREGLRKVLKCRVFPLNDLPSYKYTVICANYGGKWVLSKHKKRDTWETQDGHIEAGETPLEAAKRELFEESGIRDAAVYPVCDYWGFNPYRCSNGMVFLAVVHSIGQLPESEMQEIGMFEELPENLTYPQTSPVLYREAEKVLRSLVRFDLATEGDGQTIIELRKQIWGTTYRGFYPDSMIDDFDYGWHLEKELRRIRSPEYSVYRIVKDDQNIGYLSLRKTDVVSLQSLYLLKEYQHKGIGRLAFDFVKRYCRDLGADSFTCHCLPENWNARAFYEKMGGKVIGEDMDNEESWMNSVIYRFEVR
ncbi:MAG: GNAT family N-acetyltransferase [Oscillospiraceae bacterium]|nr:GNAT family N-acetyltransferase [Oscillospiraceae bacterium]